MSKPISPHVLRHTSAMIVLQATQIQDSRNAGYNLAYGIAEMSLSIGN